MTQFIYAKSILLQCDIAKFSDKHDNEDNAQQMIKNHNSMLSLPLICIRSG